MNRHLLVGAVLVACVAMAPLQGYQTYGVRVNGRVVELKWSSQPLRYYVTNRGVPGVSAEAFRAAAARAFGTWQAAQGVSVSAEFVAFTASDPFDDDGRVTLGFQERPDLDRVLGATSFLIDDVTGELLESDIFINSSFPWSVSSGGESGLFDLESIILHETGHLFGLGHSAIGETELREGGGRRVLASEAVMFPIAFSAGSTTGRVPRADDIAGLSSLYPGGDVARNTGSIGGRVTKNGSGVFGAHVVAFNPQTGALVGGLSVDSRGTFSIGRLQPGSYILRVEPIDDAELDSFFDEPDELNVDVDFRVTYYNKMVIVPRGGGAPEVEIEVVAK
ncbi:MAG TPA: matrixin family metalloprotease [Vicinamibacterales bacterium]|nr:matrixin family metalloprotease [Vicinamibacterales bacterium]